MKLKKLLSLSLAAAMILSMATACSSGQQTSSAPGGAASESTESSAGSEPASGGTITIMSDDNTYDGFDDYLKAAEEACGITIEEVPIPTNMDDRQSKITTLLSSGDTSVDIFTLSEDMSRSFAAAGFLYDLTDKVMTDETSAHFFDACVDMGLVDGKRYVVPNFVEYITFWVDESILKEYGYDNINTIENFEGFCEKFKQANNGKFAYGSAWEQFYLYNDVAIWTYVFGGDCNNWKDPNTMKALEFMKKMLDNGWTTEGAMADQYDTSMPKQFDGTYAITTTSSTFISTYEKTGRYGPGELQLVLPPKVGDNPRKSMISGWTYGMSAASQNVDAALKFMEWAASKEGQEAYYTLTQRTPARMDVAKSDFYNPINAKEIKEYVDGVEVACRPLPKEGYAYQLEIGAYFQKYLLGQMSLEEATDSLKEIHDKYFV